MGWTTGDVSSMFNLQQIRESLEAANFAALGGPQRAARSSQDGDEGRAQEEFHRRHQEQPRHHTLMNLQAMNPFAAYDAFAAGQTAEPLMMAYPPAYAAAPAGPTDEIRTIFITGFPTDVKDRELNNMLRYLPGYEACQMNWKSGGPQGFALFQNASAARAAVDVISGVQFDDTSVLRCEMARKNMFLKEEPTLQRRLQYSPGPFSPGSPTPFPGVVPGLAPMSPAPANLLPGLQGLAALLPGAMSPVRPQGFLPVTNVKDNPPCNTLFIGNLGDNISEIELRALFSSQPGFRQMKVVRGPKSTSCFVEFGDTGSATSVHQQLQGAILSSSDRGGVRIQYSKNPFGKRSNQVAGEPAGPGE